ncbi:MAG: AsmA-like C-terminal region-containing protein [Wolbachia endosymbiont of Meromenopon meropis]|nr:AsmA-like C-terminal region-containing protein [Wolbachia endosymbiont of Meromenopon meropis]
MRFFIYTILFILLALFFFHVFVISKDWNDCKGRIVQKLENTYNAKVRIGGKVKVSLIAPKLTVYNLYIQFNNNAEKGLHDLISVDKIEVRASLFLSLFSFTLQPKLITLFGMKSSKKNLINVANEQVGKIDLLIKESQVNLNNNSVGYANIVSIKEIFIKKNGKFTGEVRVGDNGYNFLGKVDISKKNIQINLESSLIKLLFKGKRNNEELEGNMRLVISNGSNLVNDLAKIINLNFFTYLIPSENIEILSNINLDANRFVANNLTINSKRLQACGIIKYDIKNNYANININFSKVNLNLTQNDSKKTAEIGDFLEYFGRVTQKNLSSDFGSVEVSNIEYQNRKLDKFHATLEFANEEIKVDTLLQLSETNVVFRLSGKVSNNSTLSEFNGDFLVKGDDFKSFILYFFPHIRIKKNVKNQFTISSKLHISPRMLDISDIKLLNDKEFMYGSIRINYTKKHNVISSKLILHNFNLDEYSYSLLSNFSKMRWLKNLKYDINIETSINDFILNDINIKYLGFLVKTQKDKLVVDKIRLSGEDFNVTGDIKILMDKNYIKPLLDIKFIGNKFNDRILKLSNFIEIKRDSSSKINQIQWSTKQLDFLDNEKDFDANIQINFVEFKHEQNILKNFNLNVVMINNIITVKKVDYTLGHGQISFQGYLRPNLIYIKFLIVNLDVKEISKIIGVDSINGQINFDGSIKAQGKSFNDWASNLLGEIRLQTQRIEFTNVDFNSFINNLVSSKNKSEISALTNVGIYNGNTSFENISGKASIKNGICSTSLQFRINQASGSISSNLTLSNFTLISLFRFFFILPGNNNAIYIDMHLDGPIWRPKMSFDEDQIFYTLNNYQ